MSVPASPSTLRSPAPSAQQWASRRPISEPPHLASASPHTIGQKRRESNSFKTMSTGSLVSNSPFTKMLNSGGSSDLGAPTSSPSVARSRVPVPASMGRQAPPTSADSHHPSTPPSALPPPISQGSLYSSSRMPGSTVSRKPSDENLSFRPRMPSSPQRKSTPPLTTTTAAATAGVNSGPPPFTTSSTPFRPVRHSPDLAQAPYEIDHLTKETAPFNIYPVRRVAGAVQHPPPSLSPNRRIRGPREQLTPEQVSAGSRSPTKTVTWAATEEVLEFEVDDRRDSGVSETSSMLSSGSVEGYGGASSDEEMMMGSANNSADSSGVYGYASEEDDEDLDGEEDLTFEEGGSLVVHDLAKELGRATRLEDGDDDEMGSTISTSSVADVIDEIDTFMKYDEDDRKPSPLSLGFSIPSLDLPVSRTSTYAPPSPTRSTAPTTSMFRQGMGSLPSLSAGSAPSSVVSIASESSYDSPPPSPDPQGSSGGDRSLTPTAQSQFFDSTVSEDTTATFTTTSTATSGAFSLKPDPTGYSLPEMPENSPFLAFEDDGAASSVVTLDMGPRDAAPPRAASTASTGFTMDSPILSAFQSQPGRFSSPGPLPFTPTISSPAPTTTRMPAVPSAYRPSPSKDSSVVESDVRSDVTTSSFSKFALRREYIESLLKSNEEILNSPSASLSRRGGNVNASGPGSDLFSPALSAVNRFPAPPLEASGATSPPPTPAIATVPEGKAFPVKLDQGMLDASRSKDGVVGGLLTSEMAERMESPLERLGKGEWEREAPVPRGVSRRRSRSTGDVPAASAVAQQTISQPMEKLATMPEYSLSMLDDALPAATAGFADTIESQLDYIFDNRDRSYRVRESKTVYANDGKIETVGKAGDVDPGTIWRKKRPSDMHLVPSFSMASIKSKAPKDPLAGHVFVKVMGLEFSNLPIPSTATTTQAFVDNGRLRVKAHEFTLASKVSIKKEFELVSSTDLVFHLDLVAVPPSRTLTPPPSPKKSPSTFRSIFSSPTKKAKNRAASAPAPVAQLPKFADFVTSDGDLARVTVKFADIAAQCRTTRLGIQLPLSGPAKGFSKSIAKGHLTVELFYLPSIRGIARDKLPKSADEARAGLAAAELNMKTHHEGVLTQIGGDCATWRRRNFKARGMSLVPYSEMLKKSYVEIDLSKAVGIVDPEEANSLTPDAPSTHTAGSTLVRSRSGDLDEDPNRMENGFKLVFADGDDIDFFADTAVEKAKWIDVLRKLVGRGASTGSKPAPEWAVRYVKLAEAAASKAALAAKA